MSNNAQLRGTPFNVTATNATTAIATVTGTTGVTLYVTDISVSSDSAGGTIVIKDASTVLWQARVGSNGFIDADFVTPIRITSGNTLTLQATGTAVVTANVSGFSLP